MDDVFEKLKPIMGPRLERIWKEYIVADTDTRRSMEQWLRLLLARKAGETFQSTNILLEPPPEAHSAGEYPLGRIFYGQQPRQMFGLREEEFIQHLGIFGRTGTGKTNVAFLLLKLLMTKSKPFMVFDWKRNYRDLIRLPEAGELRIYTVGRGILPLHFNPLSPPKGTSPTVWLKKLIEIMCHAYFLGEGVSYLLQQAMDSVYREWGVLDGTARALPTFADVDHWLKSRPVKGREARWMESANRAVGVLCYGEVGRVLNEGPATDLADLLKGQVVLELDALTNSDKTFLIEALLLWIHHFRLAEGSRETFKHLIVIEEAHHVLLRKKQEVTGEEAVTDVILREIRELGEGIVVLDQHPSMISKPALGNTYTTVVMNLKHRSDLSMIGDSLLLTSEQLRHVGRLDIGWGVVKLQGRWFRPFLVKFDHLPVSKGSVSDQDLQRIALERTSLSDLQSAVRSELKGLEGDLLDLRGRRAQRRRFGAPGRGIRPLRQLDREKKECAIDLTTKEREFLVDVSMHESSTVTERFSRLGLSPYHGSRVQARLQGVGLIHLHPITFRKGRRKIAVLTEKGYGQLGTSLPPARHGSIEHRYWIDQVAGVLRASGFDVQKEHPIGAGRTIDLRAVRVNRKVGIEVETGHSDLGANLEKSRDADLCELWLLATKPRTKLKILEMTQDAKSDPRIRVGLAEDAHQLIEEMKEDR